MLRDRDIARHVLVVLLIVDLGEAGRRRSLLGQGDDLCLVTLEALHFLALELHKAVGADTLGIDRLVLDADFIMQMRTGRSA